MLLWEVCGYVLFIIGVVNFIFCVIISQNGYIVYLKVVLFGLYQLDDVCFVGNGDLVVIVEDVFGYKIIIVYLVIILLMLLCFGEIEYNVVVGCKFSNYQLKKLFWDGESGMFWMGSVGYGFDFIMLNVVFILYGKYQVGGVSVMQVLGGFGVVFVGMNLLQVKYDNRDNKCGYSVSVKYVKSFFDSLDLQLLVYCYQSKGYVEFVDFYSMDWYICYNIKLCYEMCFL